MPLRVIIEQASQGENLSFDEQIEKGRQSLFDFSYPFHKEELRKEFETHFIHNFYFREIGYETEQLFKLRLRNWLNLNMPYWNKIIESDNLINEPLVNVNWTRTLKGSKSTIASNIQKGKQTTADSENTLNNLNEQNKAIGSENENGSSTLNQDTQSTGEQTGFQRNIKTDTPDSRLQITTGADGTGVIEYASGIEEDKNKNEATNKEQQKATSSQANERTSQATNERESQATNETNRNGLLEAENIHDTNSNDCIREEETTKGNMGVRTEAEMIQLYRDILLRVEVQIFKEMEQLFMLVY